MPLPTSGLNFRIHDLILECPVRLDLGPAVAPLRHRSRDATTEGAFDVAPPTWIG